MSIRQNHNLVTAMLLAIVTVTVSLGSKGDLTITPLLWIMSRQRQLPAPQRENSPLSIEAAPFRQRLHARTAPQTGERRVLRT